MTWVTEFSRLSVKLGQKEQKYSKINPNNMHKEAVTESMGNEMTSKYPYLLRVFPVVLALGY